MACLEEAFHPRQHHALAVAAEIARAQSGREHLAIHARQLALEPHLQIPRRHPRPLLLRLEQAHRHALENHVHRDQRLGLPVMIIKTWYKTATEKTTKTRAGVVRELDVCLMLDKQSLIELHGWIGQKIEELKKMEAAGYVAR